MSVRSDEQNIIAARNRELPLRFASHESCILHTTHVDGCGCHACKDAEIAALTRSNEKIQAAFDSAYQSIGDRIEEIAKLREENQRLRELLETIENDESTVPA